MNGNKDAGNVKIGSVKGNEEGEEDKSKEIHPSSSISTTEPSSTAAPAAATAPAQARMEKERKKDNVVHIGTRRSELARRQTAIVEEALREAWRGHGHGHVHGNVRAGVEGREDSSSPLFDETKDIKFIVHAMSTAGDKNQVTALHEFGAKALWTQELEVGLLEGSLDMVVHSLKDMPTQLPPALTIGAIFPREDPRDALVLRKSIAKSYADRERSTASSNTSSTITARSVSAPTTRTATTTADSILSSLPAGSIIGTSSVRRIAQLRRKYSHLQFADVRGNIQTRLAKLDGDFVPVATAVAAAAVAVDSSKPSEHGTAQPQSQPPQVQQQPNYSALILASAGLVRLNLHDRISAHLSRPPAHGHMLHAVGQGALAVEIRASDSRMHTLLAPVGCERTTRACLAERNLLRVLEGGCSVPIGVETSWDDDRDHDDSHADNHDDNHGGDDNGRDGNYGNNGKGAEAEEGAKKLTMHAAVLSTDGTQAVEATASRHIASREDADAFGKDVAAMLIDKGAAPILREIELDRSIIQGQGGA